MELDGINRGLPPQEPTQKTTTEEIEKVDDLDMAKDGGRAIDPAEEKRLVRKLDFW